MHNLNTSRMVRHASPLSGSLHEGTQGEFSWLLAQHVGTPHLPQLTGINTPLKALHLL